MSSLTVTDITANVHNTDTTVHKLTITTDIPGNGHSLTVPVTTRDIDKYICNFMLVNTSNPLCTLYRSVDLAK